MSDSQMRDAVRKLAGTQLSDEIFLLTCSVESVNEGARTCDCYNIEGTAVTDIPNVQLMADIDDGLLLIPAVGSTVIVMYSKRTVALVVMFSQIDKVLIISGSSAVTVKDGLIEFNDGSYGGLVRVQDLTKKLNNLENSLNDLISKFNAHTHILTLSSGSGTAAPTAAPETKTLTPTQQSDIENTTTKHGK